MSLKWWNENKMWLAPVAALIMWSVSVLCFVFGLSFKNPMGVMVGDTDISIWIAFSLSLANTIIQLIGNGQDTEKMDGVFKVGWYSSYVLGIASNVNALLGIIGIENRLLEWAVACSLGSMIEIMPEKLVIVWLKTLTTKAAQTQQNNNQQHKKIQFQQKQKYQAQHKPQLGPVPIMPSSYQERRPWPPESPYLQASQRGEE